MATSVIKNSAREWTEVSGIEENVSFRLPSGYTDVMIIGAFSGGQRITFMLGRPTSGLARQDLGFYYSSATYASGAVIFTAGGEILIFHPYYAGAETNFSSIALYAR